MSRLYSTICIDIKPEGDSLLKAISQWLETTYECQHTPRVYKDLMVQLISGLTHDPMLYAIYVKDMPTYIPFIDLLAFNKDKKYLSSICREVGMRIFFKLSYILGEKFKLIEVLPKIITTNSLYLDIYWIDNDNLNSLHV